MADEKPMVRARHVGRGIARLTVEEVLARIREKKPDQPDDADGKDGEPPEHR